ncbi:MAG: serine protease [Mycobacterium sp.]|nr:serine protease [Mycobacterium sp.]
MEEDPLDQAEESPRRAPSWWRRKAVLVPAGVIVAVAAVAIVAFVIVTPDDRPSVVVPPAGSLEASPMVTAAQKSVLRIHSEMPGCDQYNDSSGFVVAPNRVMSRAHDVAGAQTVEVADGQTKYAAHVVSFDPNEDVAILEVPGLPTAAMEFDTEEARPETDALVLGYQDGGDLTTTTARITETIQLKGPNIYKSETVDREVYILRGPVRQGGPLVGTDGRVLGIVFGTSVEDRETGFALTAKELVAKMSQVGNAEAVPTGACIEIG